MSRESLFRLVVWLVTWWGLGASSLLALDWQAGPGFRVADLPSPPPHPPGFTRVDSLAAGVVFTNWCDPARSVTNRNLLSGAGVACADVDGDGRTDIFLCGLQSTNRLFRNLGDWHFSDITEASGLAFAPQDSTGATFADVNGDGHPDLLVNALGHGTRLFLNDGRGHFRETTDEAGIRSQAGSTSLALADVDGDGDLDLYVANFRPVTVKDLPQTRYNVRMINDRPVVMGVNQRPLGTNEQQRFRVSTGGEVLEYGEPDDLWINDGAGHFRAAPQSGPTWLDEQGKPLAEPVVDWGLAVHFRDINGDGRPDLYVCNDLFTPDRVWLNESTPGNLRFRALPTLALRCTSTFSMGVDFGDLDRDGHLDFFVVDMLSRDRASTHLQMSETEPRFIPPGVIEYRPQVARNTLLWGRGDNTWAEAAYYGGVEASEWSWGPIFLDVDLDGFEDILVTNGQLRDFQNLDGDARIDAERRRKGQLSQADLGALVLGLPRLDTPNLAFRNRGDRTFEEVGKPWGFDTAGISQGMALADLDGDGDLDAVINNLNAVPGLYRNEAPAPRVAVRLAGRGANTQGIGSQIRVRSARPDGKPFVQWQEVIAGGRYLSGDDGLRTFAAAPAGRNAGPMEIEIAWRSGRISRIPDAKAGSLYEIQEPPADAPPAPTAFPNPPAAARPPMFEDYSNRLAHSHDEEDYNDFERQLLLPNRLSRLGPGVCWADFNGDGWDDLAIGTGRGGQVALFLNTGEGRFARVATGAVTNVSTRDLTGLVALPGNDGRLQLAAGAASWEDASAAEASLRFFGAAASTSPEIPSRLGASVGPLAAADIDGDGDLDLFVGGRVVPGRYPEPAPSQILRREGGSFVEDASNRELLAKAGLVSGAVFSDLDLDGDPDLILAVEWGPIRILRNEGGKFAEWDWSVTAAVGSPVPNAPAPLSSLTGWWNGVATGDFDGDGRLDVVASNWGLNTKYHHPNSREPRVLYFGDFAGSGTVDIVEGFGAADGAEWPERKLNVMGMAFPWLREQFPTYAAYSRAGLADILGERIKTARKLRCTTLEHTLFLNRGDHFEASPLPALAQFAPAFGICVADYDGDGDQDLFLAQNFFAAQPTTTRADAGRGLWLRNDGTGRFTPDELTGIRAYGEQRGAAVADFDHDGRIDLALGQNGAFTRLYHNIGAKPGLRIRLAGSPGNPASIGASVRLGSPAHWGARSEVHAGSGYWSQDSSELLLAIPDGEVSAEVRWPGGRTQLYKIPAAAKAVELKPDGSVTAIR